MAKRPTRLRFTEDDLADSHVKKAADRADKAVDRAEKAADKLASKKAKPKLKLETDAAGSRKAKLRFEKAEFTEIERPSVAKHMASRGAAVTLTSKAHRAVSEYEDDNIGVQAVQETTKAVESTVYTVDHAVYSHKLKAYDKAEKLVEKSDKANVNALYEKFKKDNPDAGSNPFSRWQQKRAIKKEYAAAKAGKNTASTTASASKGAGKATGKAAQGAKNITERVTEFCTTHSKTILFVLIAGLLFMILSGMFSSCSAMFQGGTQIILGTSFTAKEEDIIGADNDYKALEAALRNKINNIERTHSGYDEYRYDLDEINHNPYELAAYLTVKFEDYTRDEVQATLQYPSHPAFQSPVWKPSSAPCRCRHRHYPPQYLHRKYGHSPRSAPGFHPYAESRQRKGSLLHRACCPCICPGQDGSYPLSRYPVSHTPFSGGSHCQRDFLQ